MSRQTIRHAAGRAARQTRRNHRHGIAYGGRACSVPGYKITAYVLVIPLMRGRSPFRANRAAQTDPSTWPAPYAY